MKRRANIRMAVALAVCAGLLSLWAGGANAALIKVGNLVLKADGGFQPESLPQRHFAPIDFRGHADLINTEGGPPVPLQELTLDFDRAGKLDTTGLPVCSPGAISHSNVGQARRQCAGSLVGTGHIGAPLFFLGVPVNVRVKASLFNGPRKGGDATVVAHTF